jgi:hypothetical protein
MLAQRMAPGWFGPAVPPDRRARLRVGLGLLFVIGAALGKF